MRESNYKGATKRLLIFDFVSNTKVDLMVVKNVSTKDKNNIINIVVYIQTQLNMTESLIYIYLNTRIRHNVSRDKMT